MLGALVSPIAPLGPEKQKVRVVLVPSFAETGDIALVNLSTLECKSVHFDQLNLSPSADDSDLMDES